ncbi:MAG: hypothetical protein NTW86_09900 [Candidatus Sumerlaeota bacterium]|nr:hypothetical protein [Candidatus Sumerlaeota bacterium]
MSGKKSGFSAMAATVVLGGALIFAGRVALTAPAPGKAPGLGARKAFGAGAKAPGALAAPQALPAASSNVAAKGTVTVGLVLRNQVEQKKAIPTKWDATVTVSQGGRLERIAFPSKAPAWQSTENGWTLTTVRAIPRMQAQRAKGPEGQPVEDARVHLTLADATPATQVDVQTAQGAFSFQLNEIPFGVMKPALKGLVQISRLPNSARIVAAPTEDDFPAAACAKDGTLYVAWQAFTHGEGFKTKTVILEEPKDFSYLATPTGGDQIFMMRLDGAKGSEPMAVTPAQQDIYRLAMAVDGAGKAWVVWSGSGNVAENWDIYARCFDGAAWSNPIRLTDDPGPDILPAAATDAAGQVWIAWQGFHGGASNIFAVREEGGGFGKPLAITEGQANEWQPAIATSTSGDVAFVWDTYAKGDYDVYARVWSKNRLGEPIPIAATLQGESRAGATYDRDGRLWVAYEESPVNWGKDSGYLAKIGARLYQSRATVVRVWANGQLMEPAGKPFEPLAQGPSPKFSSPRLVCDDAGRVWLAARQSSPGRAQVGSVWMDRLTWYDGSTWAAPIFCPDTDDTLDCPPALLAQPGAGIALLSAMDGRYALVNQAGPFRRPLGGAGAAPAAPRPAADPNRPDPVNSDIALLAVSTDGIAPPGAAELKPVADAAPAPMADVAKQEAAAIAGMHAARASADGKTLRLLRGEFHRHTEFSSDGGNDGMLTDMWRYAHDMADMDWIGNGDHDNGDGREYPWSIIQKTTSMFSVPGVFQPMYTYERSVSYPDGHRNAVFPKRGVRPLPRLQGGMGEIMDDQGPDAPRPHTPDTEMLYRYLTQFGGLCASHTCATDQGTDWRDNNPLVEPVVEIYQGCRQSYEMPGAPRSNTAEDSRSGWRPFGFVSLALQKGYRLGFESSSDHGAVHISYCNVWAEDLSREAIYNAMKQRHVYGYTDNIIAEFHCGDHFMGDEFELAGKPTFKIHLVGTKPLAKVDIVKDGQYVYSAQPNAQDVAFDWTDAAPRAGKTSYYYVRGEQSDGELVWVSPMWITLKP